MSLIKSFPEVEAFFIQSRFTDEQLLKFVTDIEAKYRDAELRNSISSLIKLKLLQFELQALDQTAHKRDIAIQKIKAKKHQEKIEFHGDLEELRYLSIENIAVKLKWSLNKLTTLLKQKNIDQQSSSTLNDKSFETVKDMCNARLIALDRLNKVKNPVKIINNKNKQKSLYKGIDVYNKIEALGLGKVIYIRKK